MPLKQKSKIWDVPLEDFKKVIKESRSWNQVVKYYFNHSGNVRTIKKRVEQEKIDTSHFLGKKWSKGLKNLKLFSHPRYTLEQILVENSTYSNNQCLKKRLINSNLLIDKCYICNLPPIWNYKPLVLQVDHINGKHKDNRIENLRLLCPNCHSQTNTFCGRVKHQKTDTIKKIEKQFKNLKIKK